MKHLILIITLCFVGVANAQKLSFSADNIPDTTIYLARYFGPKLYYADTADVVNGKFSYDGSKHEAGLYAVIMPDGKYFEFIHDNEEVEMHVKDPKRLIPSTEVKKSENNKVFYEYIRFMTDNKKKANGINKEIAEIEDKKKKDKLKGELKDINAGVKEYQKSIADKYPHLFVGVLVKMSMDVELPDHPRDENGAITDSNYVYHYYINHYWDNVNLKDPRIVKTPIFHNKLDKYFSSKGVLQIPDTICTRAEQLISQTDDVDQSNKVFQYIVHHVTNKYETSKIVGMDKVFCFMATNYYCPPNNKAYWMTEENTEKVCERAEKVCRTTPGVQSIPLILPDSTEENWVGSYDIKADYTVLYFWDPNCGHCKKITPKLQTLYTEKFQERNIEIYAVAKATGDEFDKWKKFIRENELSFINVGLTKTIYDQALEDPLPLLRSKTNIESLNYADTYDVYSTPRILILDKDKVILYKQISIGQLEEILDKLTGHEDDEKLFPVEDPENGDPDHIPEH